MIISSTWMQSIKILLFAPIMLENVVEMCSRFRNLESGHFLEWFNGTRYFTISYIHTDCPMEFICLILSQCSCFPMEKLPERYVKRLDNFIRGDHHKILECMLLIFIKTNYVLATHQNECHIHKHTHTQRAMNVRACYKHPNSFSDYRWNCSRMKEMNDENERAHDRIWNNEFSKWRIFSRPLFDLAMTWSCLRLMACSGLDERYECTTFGSHKICVLCTECNIKWTAYGFRVNATVSLMANRSIFG